MTPLGLLADLIIAGGFTFGPEIRRWMTGEADLQSTLQTLQNAQVGEEKIARGRLAEKSRRGEYFEGLRGRLSGPMQQRVSMGISPEETAPIMNRSNGPPAASLPMPPTVLHAMFPTPEIARGMEARSLQAALTGAPSYANETLDLMGLDGSEEDYA